MRKAAATTDAVGRLAERAVLVKLRRNGTYSIKGLIKQFRGVYTPTEIRAALTRLDGDGCIRLFLWQDSGPFVTLTTHAAGGAR